MNIREASYTDKETLIEFQLEMAWETEQIRLNRAILENGITSVFDDPSKGCYFVAEIENQLVGSLLITYEWSDWRNGMVWWIQSVYVVKEHRQKGVFSALYQFIKWKTEKDETIKGIRLYVEQNNTCARSVYQKLGMNAEHYQMYEWLKD